MVTSSIISFIQEKRMNEFNEHLDITSARLFRQKKMNEEQL